MSWLYLMLAIVFEVSGTTAMKWSQGFTQTLPSVLMLLCYGLSLSALTAQASGARGLLRVGCMPWLGKAPRLSLPGFPGSRRGDCDKGTSLISKRQPTAAAYFRNVVREGECCCRPPPASRRATADVFVPIRSATSAWVSPAS